MLDITRTVILFDVAGSSIVLCQKENIIMYLAFLNSSGRRIYS